MISTGVCVMMSIVCVVYVRNVTAQTTAQFTQIIVPSAQAVDIVDENGQSVEKPVLALSPTILSTLLGTTQQKLRIMNPMRGAEWSVTIAPADGPGALWHSETAEYDVNDNDQEDGADADVQGGALSIDPSRADIQTILNSRECPSNVLSLGTPATFNEYNPQYSSISLISGSALYASYCGWDVTGIRLRQVVPPQLPDGQYGIHLVLTIL